MNPGACREFLIRVPEMVDITHGAVLTHGTGFHNPEHDAVILEQGPLAQIFGVAPAHLCIRRGPRNARGLATRGEATPKIHTLLNPAFLAFVASNLKNKKQTRNN